MAEQAGHPTERATPRKKAEARKKGQVALSREIPTAVILLGSLGLFYWVAESGLTAMTAMMRRWLIVATGQSVQLQLATGSVQPLLMNLAADVLWLSLPVVATLVCLGTASYLAQTGLLWCTEGLRLDLSRLNPISGIRRLLSGKAAVEMLKATLKIGLISWAGWMAVRHELASLPELAYSELPTILNVTGWLAFKMVLAIGLATAIIAAADYGYQRFEWERSLRMTRQEVKQEHRETEGDPLLKSRIRSLQREHARNRMIAAVAKADVVITNPEHVAVALQYDQAVMAAPVVVAKGAGYLAERIKAVAREHHVPVIENRFVARTLYKVVEVGREIPTDLYRAVAEILAVVYRAKGRVP